VDEHVQVLDVLVQDHRDTTAAEMARSLRCVLERSATLLSVAHP
jgi:hypothetical protein